ncbi:HD domain-containing protein [Coprinopsis marcescibilis]|uniref:5'-deoxynucleotidase n=1 Tax=Coprinopsis marcescibilis TaxID=230819 RepID=A0A5C3KWS5_COPMA|nr:HD domain-containing protein [Coprinopsis marcescibilis]
MDSSSSATPIRTFPPLYKSTGDEKKDMLAFIHVIERLKTQKRTGWVNNNVSGPESIADHMYRMAMLSMLVDDQSLDVSKCVMIALVHDLAEAQVGDITPHEGFTKAEKHKLEEDAMKSFVHDMLHGSPAAQRIFALWKEYEEGVTPEAKFVKDLDKFEMATQASEYECDQKTPLQQFFDSSIPRLRHPQVQSWGETLMQEREDVQRQRQQQ